MRARAKSRAGINAPALSLALLFVMLFAPMAVGQQFVGSATIHAPAVILSDNTGSLTTFELTVTTGSGQVKVGGPQFVGNSTIQSAVTAAQYGSAYLHLNFSKYDFNYTILNAGNNVSGPSGGMALTLLAVSALSGRKLIPNFTVTVTISSNGTVGPIGGVYDKVSAAKAGRMNFVLVPRVDPTSFYNELYLLVQDVFGIPLIQVNNITTASKFAFSNVNLTANATNYTFTIPLNVTSLPNAPLKCSNQCNSAPFVMLINLTFNFTNSSINAMSSVAGFKNAVEQLRQNLAAYKTVAGKGYLYAAANFAFGNYLDSFMFNSYGITNTTADSAITNIQNYCLSLRIPQLTTTNYEYVLGGELRQTWALYTTNSTLTVLNLTQLTTDDILLEMHRVAGSSGWCNAAAMMYKIANSSYTGPGASVVGSQSLSSIALNRISRAQQSGASMYLTTAQDAYSVNNYPLAILDADYGYAINSASATNMTTSQLINASNALSHNSTYGVWATQFSNEAQMYMSAAQQSQAHNNASQAHDYAVSAYTAALLASVFSQDMNTISGSLVPGAAQPSLGQNVTSRQQTITVSPSDVTGSLTTLAYLLQELHNIFSLVLAMFVINVVVFALLLYLLIPVVKAARLELGMPVRFHTKEEQDRIMAARRRKK